MAAQREPAQCNRTQRFGEEHTTQWNHRTQRNRLAKHGHTPRIRTDAKEPHPAHARCGAPISLRKMIRRSARDRASRLTLDLLEAFAARFGHEDLDEDPAAHVDRGKQEERTGTADQAQQNREYQ